MILSNLDIKKMISTKEMKIEPLKEDQIGPASVDLTISNIWWKFKNNTKLIQPDKQPWYKLMEEFTSNKVVLKPQELVLGITKERITLSNKIMGRLEGRSRYARLGLSVHVTSALIHPGVSNRQVLEIINNSHYPIEIKEGMRLSQAVFFFLNTKTSKPYSKVGKIAKNQ